MIEYLVVEAWIWWAIALSFVGLRFYTRISTLGWRKLTLDDLFMLCAAISYTIETIASWFLTGIWHGLSNGNMTSEERAVLDPTSLEWRHRVNGSIMNIVEWFAYVNLMWSLKSCWVVYFSRLSPLKQMHLPLRIGYISIAITYLLSMLVIPCKCLPLKKQWQIYPDPGNNCQPGYSILQLNIIMPTNAITDLYLLAIPVPMIFWKYRGISISRRISLLILWSAGFIIIAFAILRSVSLVGLQKSVITGTSRSNAWSQRESFVAVTSSNLPIILPLFQHWYAVLRGRAKLGSFTGSPISQGLELEMDRRPAHIYGRGKGRGKANGNLMPWEEEGDMWDEEDEQIMVPKNTLQLRGSSTRSLTPVSPGMMDEEANIHGNMIDLVPKKEKSQMRTTVHGGASNPYVKDAGLKHPGRWRNRSRDARRGSEMEVDVEEGKIMVVEEFTYTSGGGSNRNSES